jgi:hypothetical protein
MNTHTSAFESLTLPRKEVAQMATSRYRVYTDASNFTLVDGGSALEALQASGQKQAHHIQRETIFLHNVLKVDALVQPAVPAPAAPETAPAMAETASAAPAAAPAEAPAAKEAAAKPAPAAPLSSDDVNKLLQENPAATPAA